MSILDHVGLTVSDMAKSKAFYTQALAPIGITMLMDYGRACGFGKDGKPEFWLGTGEKPDATKAITPVHVCFVAKDRAQVDAFYAAAIAAGGKDNGKPGIREIYHPNYYGAFVLDPDGHNAEACIHRPE
jgi:catechol 2,3-dioxygenase-like lactoylglutathione lyase family enzyme